MSSFESRVDLDNRSWVVKGARTRGGFTLKTDVAVYEEGTVLAQQTADDKLVPLINLSATDGTKAPKYILKSEVDATGGDIADVVVYELGEFYEFGIVLRNSLTLDDDYVTLATNFALTIRQALRMMGMNLRASIDIDGPENS